MKLSVSTKIFLGLAVVIIAFGIACGYIIYRMNALRASATFIWQEVTPVAGQLEGLGRQIRAPEEFLNLSRPSDQQRLSFFLPQLNPFEQIRAIELQLRTLAADDAATEADRQSLLAVAEGLQGFRKGGRIQWPEGEGTAEESFERLLRRTVKLATEGQLRPNSPETRATQSALRAVNRAVGDAAKRLEGPISTLNARFVDDERAATLTVVLIASGALVLSLLMLAMSQLTLAPIRQLRAGARRIAAGHYDESVEVRSGDEIGQLAEEFNRMALALQERDRELERQRAELLRADRLATIGKVSAQITHEVRNPLSSIGLNAELLEEELEDRDIGEGDELREVLHAIVEEVQRLKSITEEYLRYARMPTPDLQAVDLGNLLQQLTVFIAKEAAEAGVEVDASRALSSDEGGPGPIEADPDQLRQVVLNLARNAIEALRGGPEPRRLWFELEGRGEQVVVRICDTGPGIDPAIVDRLFEPFVTSRSGGTGLGLALSEQIVTEHGGTIGAESSGEGAVFTITLPATPPSAPVVEDVQPG